MSYKKIIPYINAENEAMKHVLQLAKKYSNEGADELLIYNYSKDEKSRELFLNQAREIAKEIDVPFTIGCYINRFEDVKKALYTGAKTVLLPYGHIKNKQVIKEAKDRFGNDKLILELDMMEWLDVTDDTLAHILTDGWVGSILIKHFAISNKAQEQMDRYSLPIIIRDSLIRNDIFNLLQMKEVMGIATNFYEDKNLMKVKHTLKDSGIEVNTFENKVDFPLLKVNEDGLIPVVAQDYKSGEVLMLAYMNEEAYNKTITTGIMTYYSRSRDELWVKGDTSGNYQYVKELKLDCDNDTILAKVLTLGPACHTGQTTCFHKEIMKKDYTNEDPFHVFQDVYEVIKDRKLNPKEGSYTNYLFDKGIDKILKKCGEESAEIIIAAKNPGAEELRYEISDYLYHMMVLMVECGLDWTDVTNELAHRK